MTIKVDWTEGLKEEARRLREEGMSLTAVTEELWVRHPELRGKLTRNAVIGKLNRMRIVVKVDAPAPPAPSPSPPVTVPEPPSLKSAGAPVVLKQRRAPMLQPKTTYPTAPIKIHDDGEPVPRRLTIHQLNDDRCRWPIGRWDARPPYLYCGHASESGTPYCPHHNDRARNKDVRTLQPRPFRTARVTVGSR